MSVDSDVQVASDIPVAADVQEAEAPAQAGGNPLLLGLLTFLPGALTLGLWYVGYLDTANLPGGMIPAVTISAGLFELIACVWAARIGASVVAAAFGVFAAFWISFGFLLLGLVNGWFGISSDPAVAASQVAQVQATYLLSFLIAVAVLTLATMRLPLAFTVGFTLIVITFALTLIGVTTANAGLFPIAGIVTFLFCAVFAYILVDGINQDLGGRPLPMGNPIVK
jgi:succinate-acetate transporter protein